MSGGPPIILCIIPSRDRICPEPRARLVASKLQTLSSHSAEVTGAHMTTLTFHVSAEDLQQKALLPTE